MIDVARAAYHDCAQVTVVTVDGDTLDGHITRLTASGFYFMFRTPLGRQRKLMFYALLKEIRDGPA